MTNFSRMSAKELREKQREWSEAMFTHTKKGADIDSVALYTPLIQACSNELMARFIRRSTWALLFVGVLTLTASAGALIVSYSALSISQNTMPDTNFDLGSLYNSDDR